ncbi:tumor protein p53-inducible nuclear protein 1-like isoform X2 [Pecten maximus]|uniref:tumor protein p53-inducible nuclear protein 1-like isoform X2 n=1 Tax=Pecten maximus TaxID=6579 RepID=UPI0014582886|nr:tumor protein p53-inducible nuclear protein 1-like isoform X2 [Pecten maximus]
MLTSVASYLFGGSGAEETETTPVNLETKPAPDQDWVLVDVPGGATSSQVGMDPMENLLIEHPSMSVYNSHCSGGSAGEESDLSESSTDNISRTIQKRGLRPRNASGIVVQQSPRKPQAVAARAGIITQTDSFKSSQRSKQYKETRRLTRATLVRQNQTTRLNSAAKRRDNHQRINCPKSSVMSYQAKH